MGSSDKLSDVLRQTNFGNGTINTITNLGANTIDATEIFCDVVGFAEIGVGAAKLFKGKGLKLLKNKGSMNFSNLNSGKKNVIVTLESNIKQGYVNAGNDVTKGSGAFDAWLLRDGIDAERVPMNSELFQKIKTAYERKGGLFLQDADAQPLLNYRYTSKTQIKY